MNKLFFFLSLLLLSTLSASSQTTTAAASNDVLFVLDGSGSMWQKLDGTFKIAIAKTVLEQLVSDLPSNTRAGLIAYGHNRKSDCADIETLIPIQTLDQAAFKTRLKALNPIGMTPIARSIEQAISLIKADGQAVTCILISDGLETCDGDACALVKKARQAGVKITMHVIGFGLAEKDLSPLECLAQAGGGQYFPANDASELSKALEQSVVKPPTGGGYLSVRSSLDGKLRDAVVEVYRKGETKETAMGRTYEHEDTNPRVFLLPAGDYTVQVQAVRLDGDPVQRFEDIRIVEKDTVALAADFSQAKLEVLVTRNSQLSDAVVVVRDAKTTKVVTQSRTYKRAGTNPKQFSIIPGYYEVEVRGIEISGKPVKIFSGIRLEAGGKVALEHDFTSGELQIGAKKGGEYVDVVVRVNNPAGKNVASGRTYMSERTNPKKFTLAPGKYKVQLKPVKPKGLAEKTIEVEVKPDGLVTEIVNW